MTVTRGQAWGTALRPRSLLLALSPVMVGLALGWRQTGLLDAHALLVAGLAGVAALLMQLLTNLQNDVGYTVRGGARVGARSGPHHGLPRATAQGWLSVRQVQVAVALLSAVACALGLALVAWRGWPVLAIGSASLLAALAYMGGPRPIAYTPFGELTVLVFFGLVAVLGTEWLLAGVVARASMLPAVAVGLLAALPLAVNNHRDITHDRGAGRRTLAVLLGEQRSQRWIAALLLAPYALLPAIAGQASGPGWARLALLLPALALPGALALRRALRHSPPGAAFNPLVGRCFQHALRWCGLLTVGLVLARLAG